MTLEGNEKICEKTIKNQVVNPYSSAVNNLSQGIIGLYKSPLMHNKKQLDELTAKQEFLIDQIHYENLKLSEVQHSSELQDTFAKLKVYHNKLSNLKKDMKSIYERSSKLKKRALHLKEIKETEGLNKSLQNPVGEPNSSYSH